MLKKFSNGLNNGNFNCIRRPNFYQRCCCRLRASVLYIFSLSAFMLFAYLLWAPGWYLMLVLFLQVLGLLLWLYNYRI
ncbi:MAG: hypothetical protein OSJ64_06010 [Firmicutes bacterium]|mgnify:CR=1 FL=1|jgi:hypothetical protein|nr:hypothetical protein [Bacillota bacterium]